MAQGRINFTVGFNVDQSGLQSLKSSLASLQNVKLGSNATVEMKENLKTAQKEVEKVQAALQKAFNPTLNTYNIDVFKQKLKESGSSIKQVGIAFNKAGAQGTIAFRNLASAITSTKLPLQETHNLLRSMGTTLMNTIKWSVASNAINTVTGSVQKAWSFTKQLDESLNNIMVVTDKSAESMERFARQANKAAKELGKSTTDYTNAALIYYQQGLSDTEVAARTETTLKAANVTGQSTSAVSEQLTAVWNGYKVSANETELYIDKLSAVAATTAADLEELSTGMSKVASAANNMGVDIDQLNAQLATVISVTRQAPESVGTAFKTIFARISDIEAGLDTETTLGEYTSQMAEIGINVLDANNHLRDMGDVVEEIGLKWNNLSREQQISLAQTMAGTRQYNNLLALFDNWKMYESAMKTSINAAGTLQKQQDIYMESMEAHLEKLETAGERVYDALLDPDNINPLIDALTEAVDLFGSFVESIGGGGTLLMALVPVMTKLFSGTIANGVATFATNLTNASNRAQTLKSVLNNINEIKTLGLDKYTGSITKLREELVLLKQYGVITNEWFNELTESFDAYANAANNFDFKKTELQKTESDYSVLTNNNLFNGINFGENIDFTHLASIGKTGVDQGKSAEDIFMEQTDIGTDYQRAIENLELMNSRIDTLKENNAQAVASAKKLADAFQTGTENLDQSNQKIIGLKKNYEALKDTSKKIASSEGVLKRDKDSIGQLNKEIEILLSKNEILETDAEELSQKVTKLNNITNRYLNKTQTQIQNTDNGVKQITSGTLPRMEAELEHLQTVANNTMGREWLELRINGFIQMASNISMAASAIRMLFNLGDIWSNDDLDLSEKILQSIQNITSALGLLAPTILWIITLRSKHAAATSAEAAAQSSKMAVDILELKTRKEATREMQEQQFWTSTLELAKDQLTKAEYESIAAMLAENKVLDDNTKKKLANAAADTLRARKSGNATHRINRDIGADITADQYDQLGQAFSGQNQKPPAKSGSFTAKWKAKGGLGKGHGGTAGKLGGAAAGAVAGGLAAFAIISAFDNQEKNALKEETEQSLKLNAALSEVQASYDNLSSSIDKLSSMKTSLDDLTVGTVEWRKAIADINNEVYTLIEEYPELAHAVRTGENGALELSEDALEKLEEKKLTQLQASQSAKLGGLTDKATANLDVAKNEAAETLTYGNEDWETAAEVGGVATGALAGAAAGAAIGSFIPIPIVGTLVGGVVGALAGSVVGLVSGAAQDAAEEDKEKQLEKYSQTEEFQKIINAYRESGDAIFNSQETLAAAIGTEVSALDNVTQELIGTQEGLAKFKDFVDASSQEQLANYNEKISLGAEIMGADASEAEKLLAGKAIKDRAEELRAEVEEEFSGLNEADEAAAKKAFDELGWEYSSIGTNGSDKVQRLDKDGNVIDEYTADEIYDLIATQKVKTDIKKENLSFDTSAIDDKYSKGVSNTLTKAAVQAADFTHLKIGEIQDAIAIDLNNLTEAEKELYTQLAKANGSSLEKFLENIKVGQTDANDALAAIWTDVPAQVKDRLNSLDWNMQELSLSATDKFVNTYTDLFKAGGDQLVSTLDSIIMEAGALSDELITELMNQDWSTISDPEDVVNTILKNTGTEHLSAEAQNALTDIVRVLSGKIKDLKTMQSEYAEFQSLMEKATMGASWSAEEYEKLNNEQRKYFTVMADGTALLIGDAYKLKAALREETQLNTKNNWQNAAASLAKASSDMWAKSMKLEESDEYKRIESTEGRTAANKWRTEQLGAETANIQALQTSNAEAFFQYARTLTSEEELNKAWEEAYKITAYSNYGGYDITKMKEEILHSINLSNLATSLNIDTEEAGELYNAFDGDLSAIYSHQSAMRNASVAIEAQTKATEKASKSLELLGTTAEKTDIIFNLIRKNNQQIDNYDAQYEAKANVARQKYLDVYNQFGEDAQWGVHFDQVIDGIINGTFDANSWTSFTNSYLKFADTNSPEQNAAFWEMDSYVQEILNAKDERDEAKDDLKRQNLDLNLQAFENEIEIAIKPIENQKAFDEFKRNFIKETDFTAQVNFELSAFSEATEALEAYKKELNYLTTIYTEVGAQEFSELEKVNTYMLSSADMQAQKEELINKLMEEGVNLLETQKSIEEQYINYQDAVNAAYERQIELIDSANQALDHQKSLIELMYGDKATKELKNYYASQAQNAQEILKQRKTQYAQDKADFDAMTQNRSLYSQEQQDALTSQYMTSTNAYLEAVNTTLSARREQFLNESAIALEEFDERITGVGHEKAKEEWDWMQDEADDYLNSLDAAFGIEAMIASYNKAVNETTDVRVQQKINELREKELKILREKDKLSQYDLDRAQKQLDVLQARIALEDAQQNKSQMRLMRGANGTYSYQYVADQNAIDEAREKLNKAQQELVDLDEEQLKSNTEKIYDIYAEMMEKIAGLTDEAEINAVVEQYTSRLESLGMGMNDLMDNIRASVNMASGDLGLGDKINTIFPWLDSAWMQTVMKASEEGWGNIFNETVQSILASLERYVEDKDALLGSSSITVGSGTDTITHTIADFDSIVSTFTDQVNEQMVPAQTDVITGLQNMAGEMKILAETTLPGLRLIVEQYKDEIEKTVTDNKFATNTNYTVELSRDDKGQITGATLKAITSAATGMYTGEWGPEGKLAVLHEKELVLNKQDTANILSAVDLVRSLGDSMMNTMAFMSSGYAMSAAAWELAKELIIEQTVHINAEFPNATDRAEIEAAFEELVGLATQHAYENKRG